MMLLQLILKDFRANWFYQLCSMIILFNISSVFMYATLKENGSANPELFLYFMVVLLSSSVVSLLFMVMDELYHTDRFFASLPVSRNQMVWAKYSTSIIQISLALVVHFLGAQFAVYMKGGTNNPELNMIYNPILWLLILITLTLFKSYAYPIYFKFGLSKGAVIQGVIQFIIIFSFVAIMINYNKFWHVFQEGISWVGYQNRWMLFAIITASFLFTMSGSIAVSTKIFKNRDL